MGVQIARALREAHAHGIVHRDLKPANVMIVSGRDGEELVKLLDFGIGKIVDAAMATSDPRAELTQEGRFVGSPLYMSPEQIAHGKVDARTDIYSLGVLLYRCIAGVHPFHKENTALVMLAHLNEQPAPLRERARDVPVWLDDLIQRMLVKDPNQRLSSMEELLRVVAENAPIASSVSSSRLHAPVSREVPAEAPTIQGARITLAEGAHTPHTHHATTLSSPPIGHPLPAQPKKRSPVIFLVPAFIVLGLVVAIAWRATHTDAVTPASSSSTSNAAPARTFNLHLDSQPSGARVSENGKILGQTPLDIAIDEKSVEAGAREFVLELDGYQRATVYQGRSEKPVTREEKLVAIVDAPPAPTETATTKTTGGFPKKPPPPKPSQSASVAPKPPDINLVR
jgi:serine/threonine-protein kinase